MDPSFRARSTGPENLSPSIFGSSIRKEDANTAWRAVLGVIVWSTKRRIPSRTMFKNASLVR